MACIFQSHGRSNDCMSRKSQVTAPLFFWPFRLYKQGAVSFMAMNLQSNKSVDIQLAQNLQEFGVDEYLFSPEGCITSRLVTSFVF